MKIKMPSMLFAFVFSTFLVTGCATPSHTSTELKLPENLHETQKFVPHHGPGPMQNYLAQNINEKAVSQLRVELENRLQQKLLHRDEAHITVITPPEYDRTLSKKIKIAEIEALAKKMKIQDGSFKPVCLGRGSVTIQGQAQSTYYLVVNSEASFRLRHAVQDLFVHRGGKVEDFNADHFYPHITIAYTQRDLHYEDGVIKDERSCIYSLK